jgi:hypothetical protein
MQTMTVSSDPTGARVFINGTNVGTTPLRHQVHRSEDVLVEVQAPGYQRAYRSSHRTLSAIGIVDLIGGCIILVPFLGLLSPAAWRHEPATFGIVLDPQVAQPAAQASP